MAAIWDLSPHSEQLSNTTKSTYWLLFPTFLRHLLQQFSSFLGLGCLTYLTEPSLTPLAVLDAATCEGDSSSTLSGEGEAASSSVTLDLVFLLLRLLGLSSSFSPPSF